MGNTKNNKGTILIVEDEGVISLDLQSFLKKAGYGIAGIATSGEEALEKTKKTKPDLVLMDIVLKGKTDGIETARRIHALYGIPSIFLTAYADEEKIERAKGAQPFGYILKPFKKEELEVAIEMALYRLSAEKRASAEIYERKQIEDAIKASEIRYRRLFESAKDGILILDFDTGRIVDVNPFLTRMLDSPKTRIIGKQLWELGFFKDIARNKTNFLRLKRNKSIRYENLPLETADGRQINVEFVSNVYEVDHHRVIQCNIRDITERRKAEEEILRLKEFNERIIQNSPSGIVTTDIGGNITSANPAVLRLLGSPSETQTKQFNVLTLKPMKEQGLSPLFKKCLKTGKDAQAYGMPYTSYWGKSSFISLKVVPLSDNKGKQIGSVALIEDVSERKKAEEAIADLSLFPSENPRPVLRIDNKAFLLYANPSSRTLLGNKLAIDKKLPSPLLKIIRPHLQSKIQMDFEFALRDKTFSCFFSPALGRGYINLYLTDVTERNKAVDAIVDLAHIPMENPNPILRMSTKAILLYANPASRGLLGGHNLTIGKKLPLPLCKVICPHRQSKKQIHFEFVLEKKSYSCLFVPVLDRGYINLYLRDITQQRKIEQAKTELVSLASHQLRTPPTGVKWFANMLLEEDVGRLNKKQRSYLNEIIANNQKMIDLVHSLLDASRIELGTFVSDVKLRRIQVTQAIDDILSELGSPIHDKKLAVIRNYEKGLPAIQADKGLLKIVLNNLIGNAVQYTPDRGKIKLNAKRQKSALLVTVSDTGCGIPKHQQPKIFSKFFRADNAAEMDAHGTGLGLYISKKIVDEMGGTLEFKSTLDKGTAFYLGVPIRSKMKSIIKQTKI